MLVVRDQSQALAEFSVSDLKGNFVMKSDNSMDLGLTILDCNLDDVRPEYRKGITK